ncbi:DUF6193 family natural product biosynthesis protein [Streptomyces canus]|uniref:DUF6193 family natural product biosynthesis protein n=1 Tax=Streptomyces canus TaxID=58343 RepID=UPI0033A74C5F
MAKKDILGTAPDDPVAAKWQVVRDMDANLIGTALVEAAYANPALRALFPLVRHGSLQFSRCTRLSWFCQPRRPAAWLARHLSDFFRELFPDWCRCW